MALVGAAWRGDVVRVKEELDKGADINQKDEYGETGLHLAARNGHTEVVEVLVSRGADVNVRNNGGHTGLHQAAMSGHTEVVEVLVSGGADVNVRNKTGDAPLHLAAWNGRSECVAALTRAGALLDTEDDNKLTPLHDAASNNKPSTVELLLSLGADPRHSSIGRALEKARKKGYSDVVTLLEAAIEKGRVEPTDAERDAVLDRIYPKRVHEKKPYSKAVADISEHQFSNHERVGLLSCKIYNIIPIGDTGAGKTSLAQSLVLKTSYMTAVNDRTVVAQLLSWNPSEKEDTIYLIYDIGGHGSYKSTSQCFMVNASTTVRLLCHDVTSPNIEASVDWMKETQTAAPDSKLILCLTKIDKLSNDADKKGKIQACLDSFSRLIGLAIQQTNHSQKLTTKGTANWNLYAKYLSCYQSVKDQIKSNPILLSCEPGHEDLLNSFREYLLKLGESQQPFLLSDIDKKLFLRIGRLGRKEPMVEQRREVAPRATSKTVESVPTALERNLSQVQIQRDQKSLEPSVQKVTEELRQQYISLKEALTVFKGILQEKQICTSESDQLNRLKRSLENLSKKGLLRYFLGDEDLEKIIFNDISTLINILRAIYHHGMEEFLKFDQVDATLRENLYSNKRKPFEHDISQLQQHGILSMKLLKVLLKKSHCLIAPVIVVKLLAKLTIAYVCESTHTGETQLFIPYFIEKMSDHIAQYRSRILSFDQRLLSLHTVLKGELPLSFFHAFIVKVYGEFHGSHFTHSQNETWCKGLFFTLGKKKAKFMICYNSKKEIECYVQADISTVEGHRILWKCVKFFDTTAMDTRQSRFPGLILDYILLCTHCKLMFPTEGVQQVSAYEWDIETQLLPNESREDEEYGCRDGSEIPAALMAPLPKDEIKAKEFLSQLHDYLQNVLPGIKQTIVQEPRQAIPLDVRPKRPAMQGLPGEKTETERILEDLSQFVPHPTPHRLRLPIPSDRGESTQFPTNTAPQPRVDATPFYRHPPPQSAPTQSAPPQRSQKSPMSFPRSTQVYCSPHSPQGEQEETLPKMTTVEDQEPTNLLMQPRLLESEEPMRQPNEVPKVPGYVPQFTGQPGQFTAHPPGQPPDVHFHQMFAKMSEQMFAQGKALAHGMKEMEEKLEKAVRLDAGDASKVDVVFKHQVLQDHKDDLIQHMDSNPDLIASLISEGLLAENTTISADTNDKSRTKRILLQIQDVDDVGLCKFIRALQSGTQCGANGMLGNILTESYKVWCQGNASK